MRVVACTLLATAISSTALAQEALAPFDAPQVSLPYWTSITSLGDFNADGHIDGVGWYWQYVNRYDRVRLHVWTNDGTGGFDLGWNTVLTVTGGQQASWDTATGRLDTSAADDFAVAFNDLVYTYTTDIFGRRVVYRAWREAFAVQSLVLTDLDGDGLDDLALVGTEVRVYRNTGTTMSFAASFPLAGTEIFAGEFDGDGQPDLLVPGAGTVTLLHWNGSGLQGAGTLTHGVQPIEAPMHVIGDVDADGDDDIVVFSEAGQYVTLRRTGSATFLVESRAVGGPATGLADLDGDGDLDGVCCGGGGPAPQRNTMASTFHISMNRGGGAFAPAYTVAGLGAFRLAGAADVDADGDNDLVAGRTVWFNRGGFAVDPQPDVIGAPTRYPPSYDWDRDGDPDVVLDAATVLRNDGAGGLAVVTVALPAPPVGASYVSDGYRGDFDGDSDVDLVVGVADQASFHGMRLLVNAGGGGYVDGGPAAAAGVSFANATTTLGLLHVVADVDGDGDEDIVQGENSGLLETVVWHNDGNGFFTRGASFTGGVPMATEDIDRDGHLDMVTHRQVWFGSGGGAFVPGPALYFTVNPETDRMAIADLDQNGLPDLAFFEQDRGNVMVCWNNQGGRLFYCPTFATYNTGAGRAHTIDAEDFDGDGHLDLIVWPAAQWDGDKTAVILFGNSQRWFPRELMQVVDMRELVDADGDGDLDAIGPELVRGGRATVPVDGYRLQYGDAMTGLGSMAPTMGATGPFHAGGTIELSVSGAPGGSFLAIGLGGGPVSVPDWPLPGMTGFLAPLAASIAAVASGSTGEPGTGAVRLPVAVPAAMTGAHVCMQAWAWDPSTPTGVLHSNGLMLEIR